MRIIVKKKNVEEINVKINLKLSSKRDYDNFISLSGFTTKDEINVNYRILYPAADVSFTPA